MIRQNTVKKGCAFAKSIIAAPFSRFDHFVCNFVCEFSRACRCENKIVIDMWYCWQCLSSKPVAETHAFTIECQWKC